MKKIIYILLFVGLFNAAYSQNEKEYKKLMSEAESHMLLEQYPLALDLYKKAEQQKPSDPEACYQIGLCYSHLRHETQALPYLETARKGGINEADLDYHLATAYHFSNKFDDALKVLNELRPRVPKSDKEMLEKIDMLTNWCNNAKVLTLNPLEVKITNLGPVINSHFDDFVPAVSADETVLMFTSRRETTTGGKKDEVDHKFFEDVYMSVKDHKGEWTTPVDVTTINTHHHDACVALAPDGQELFIYRDNGKNGGDLYVSDLHGSKWTTPKPVPGGVNTKYWEPSATVTADEKVIFFTSNREGGVGGRDIYMAKRNLMGEFTQPILLSTKINTRYDEDSPFIHADGKTLYFSSKGHNSMGGFDIFSCEINTETGEVLSDPVNVGYPINTPDDDVFFVWSADNKRAYFSSEREGGYGEKDIYMMEIEDKESVPLVIFKGKVQNCDKSMGIAATITVTDNSTQEVVGIYTTNVETGKYTIILPAGKDYGIAVEANGHIFHSKNISVPNLDHFLEIPDTICLQPLRVGTVLVLKNVFFDVDKATLRPASTAELNRLYLILTKNPDVKIEISGHTDSDGNDDHNMKLSDARAKAVVDYLIKKGIDQKRLVWKGYGETKPVVANDTPENKQQNRRTEIKVIE